MVEKEKKVESGVVKKPGGVPNAKGTYGILDEKGEVVRIHRILQLFRGVAAANNRRKELERKFPWLEIHVERLKLSPF